MEGAFGVKPCDACGGFSWFRHRDEDDSLVPAVSVAREQRATVAPEDDWRPLPSVAEVLAHNEMTRRLVDALKAPITRRIAPSVAVDVDDDGDLVVVTRSEAEAFAAAHPYAAGAILGGVAHRSEGGDHGA